MSERLPKLLHQRALIQSHLAWLDQEIAREGNIPSLPGQSQLPPPNLPATPRSVAAAGAEDADKILSQFQKAPTTVSTDTRRGCLLYFCIAMTLLALGAVLAYWLYARHLGRWW